MRTYAVTFLDTDTKQVSVATFTDKSKGAARSSFEACYRHGNYTVLSIVAVPGTEMTGGEIWEG